MPVKIAPKNIVSHGASIAGRQQCFMFDQVCILAWNASVQRSNLYKPDVAPKDRRSSDFRTGILTFVKDELLPQYRSRCTERMHVANIERLVKHGNKTGRSVLRKEGYKFGVAQKLLNLLLKYLWCLRLTGEPPHCPIDRIVLERTKLRGKMNWTDIRSKKQYERAVEAIRDKADEGKMSLAVWELRNYRPRAIERFGSTE